MSKRRSRGDGGLHWDERRQRWIASVTIGYTPAGKRIVRRGSGRTKTEAKAKLKQVMRDHEDGLPVAAHHLTVADAVNDWLTFGLVSRSAATRDKNTYLCRVHLLPELGSRKLRELTARDVDRWLAGKSTQLATSTLRDLHACLTRALNRAMMRDEVKRNVAALCTTPTGQPGRPSKSLTLEQATAVLAAAESSPLYAYVTLSLLIGARTEELRALTWDHVNLVGRPDADPAVPPFVELWRSVRAGGDTKTKKSRRTLALPRRCVIALQHHQEQQQRQRTDAGWRWHDHGLVFTTAYGTALDAANVRRSFRRIVAAAGLNPADWTPRELRHSFVSLLSADGVPIETIADLCGHAGTIVTEKVYRQQLRPVLLGAATVMDRIFAEPPGPA